MGAGTSGSALLELMVDEQLVEVVGVLDRAPRAPGLAIAASRGIPVYHDVASALAACRPCVAFNLTGSQAVELAAVEVLGPGSVIGGGETRLIWRMLDNLHAAKKELSYQAMHDVLTGKYNRRFMLESVTRGISEAKRYKSPYSVALLDLDRFKLVNDTYGHAAGDTVLKNVADHLSARIRASDYLGRWGGEEFLILLPQTREEDATLAIGNLLARLKRLPIDVGKGKAVHITFSAGVVAFSDYDSDRPVEEMVDHLLVEADRRMYEAKARGRGCVVGMEKIGALLP